MSVGLRSKLIGWPRVEGPGGGRDGRRTGGEGASSLAILMMVTGRDFSRGCFFSFNFPSFRGLPSFRGPK